MPEARFLKILIVALLILNIGTLGYLWMDHSRPHHFPPPPRHEGPPGPNGRGGPAAFLNEALELTDQQESTYKTLRQHHHATMLGIRSEMKESKRKLYALMKSADTVSTHQDAQRLLDSLAEKQRRIETITYEHFRDVRALCTPQQQEKFDEVIGEALEQMR